MIPHPPQFKLQWIAVALIVLAGCRPSSDRSNQAGGNQTGASSATSLTSLSKGEWFVERAEQVGLHFTHVNGMSGKLYQVEIMAPGVGLFDYDNDGDLDVYLVQGQMLGIGKIGEAPKRSPGREPLQGRLYRNDLTIGADGTRLVRFSDVTSASGIVARVYGMGIATGDFDNDGCVDLYLTNFGPNQMVRNNCNGTFTDVSRRSGTAAAASWSVSASFADVDRDGWLDLFVGNYLEYSTTSSMPCFSMSGRPDYCSPNVFGAQPSRLYHNNGDGTFTDVTASALVGGEFGPALGVSTADVNGDGWIDLYVANDGQANQLWINQRDGTFQNTALLAGAALTANGKAEASMGVDAGDFDNDGDEDLFMTELTGEGNNLYVNDGSGTFDDRSGRSGLGPSSLAYTGFGTAWIDVDNDGWLDVLTVNGAVRSIPALVQANDPFPLHQRKQLIRNLGGGRFEDVTAQAGAAFTLSEVGRGAAFGDIDNDGDVDVLVGNNNGPVRLLINEVGSRNHWVGLRLIGERVSRDMLGARVEIAGPDGSTRWRRARADGSYASANDPRVLVGLGTSNAAPRVRVVWPSGRVEQWTNIAVDRYTTLKEGSGK